jgi:hypothetical protein
VAASRLTVGILPGIELDVIGDAAAIRHFRAEYWSGSGHSPAEAHPPARLPVSFVHGLPADLPSDGHRSVYWQARLDRAGPAGLSLEIALRGWPRWFGLSLVQGYLVEPAVSLLVAESGAVLLPAAGIMREGRVDLLIGRSRSGKSSLSMRALAAGLPILGDDQVHVGRDGVCTRFPRRLRVYDDLAGTAPAAMHRLPGALRTQLAGRRLVRLLTRGRIRPSLAVDIADLGRQVAPPGPLGRIVLLKRVAGDQMRLRDATADEAVRDSIAALSEQRARLARVLPDQWHTELAATLEGEGRTLSAAFASVPVTAVEVPESSDPGDAVTGLADVLGLP